MASLEYLIEPVSPATSPIGSPEYLIELVSPAASPIASVEYIIEPVSPAASPINPDPKTIELSSEWFDESNKAWRRGKIFSRKTQLFYYKTNTDSPFTLEDYKTKVKFPNANKWIKCCYTSPSGNICQNQGILYEDDIKQNPEYDYEKYTDIYFCQEHMKYKRKEQRKRELQLECAILERYIKNN
jgi:hypothetical protein